MKKYFVVLLALAMVMISTVALAADVTIGGQVFLRSKNFNNLDFSDATADTSATRDVSTQERVRIDINAKAGDAKAKVTIENDWDTFGRYEAEQGTTTVVTGGTNTAGNYVATTGPASRIKLREAWLLTPIPGTPVFFKAGHMFLQLSNAWFIRSNKYGSDALVAYADFGGLHLGVVDVKISEGAINASDDIDAYVLVATNKFGDATAGINILQANDRRNGFGFNTAGYDTKATNVGLHFGGKVGPIDLKAELDMQSGTAKGATTSAKLKGNQIVIEGKVPMDALTVNFTVARGSGVKRNSTSPDFNQMVTFLDKDVHYTLVYEFLVAGACGAKNQGFCGTTALNAGAMFAATKNLSIGGDIWILQATEKVANKKEVGGADTSELGNEIDLKANWKLADGVTWNWVVGHLIPGAGLGKDASTNIQGVLTMAF